MIDTAQESTGDRPGVVARLLKGTEATILTATLALATVLLLVEAIGRPFGGFHVAGKDEYVKQLTLWLAFVGGLAAAIQGKHLTLSTAEIFGEGRARRVSRLFGFSVSAAVIAVLGKGAFDIVRVNRAAPEPKMLPIGIPEWMPEAVMPAALALMALVFAYKASDRWSGRAVAFLAIPAAFAIGLLPPDALAYLWPLALVVLAAAFFGAPVFVAMGGIAAVLFFSDGSPVSAVTRKVYSLIGSPMLPAIPLLTAAGYVLAESAAAERLVRFFRALFGWMPGGLAVMVAAVCALFTTFTGGSGVTIIALGGLVYPMLREGRLLRGVLARPRDGLGFAGAAVPSQSAGRALFGRGQFARPGSPARPALHRWPAARAAARRAHGGLRHLRRPARQPAAAGVLLARNWRSRPGRRSGSWASRSSSSGCMPPAR